MSYPIGTPGTPWSSKEKYQWYQAQTIKRSYFELVLSELEEIAATMAATIKVEQYGLLQYPNNDYPLFVIKSLDWQQDKPTILITGGVHGYETSGVHGALRFVKDKLKAYQGRVNFVVAPCISPWGYETINRWNVDAIDPNRSFYADTPAQESAAIMAYLAEHDIKPLMHIDLHETTDTDNTEFRPALSARDAIDQKSWNIPDGFYGVGDTGRDDPAFQKAIIDSVKQVTHIAPADENGKYIGVALEQFGVINYDCKGLSLCAGMTDASYVSTTEVYPDSELVDDENCVQAQVAAIVGGLDYVLAQLDS
ncbi:M14 family metallopeptidase [Thalassotalea agarivorans]|uniref:Succinylglutamate desuccinylase / Aspartoacylase family protein n=1 Tax=Thalassotalea agarivorans TaxID=349064 RepID=A0A1I0GHW6_THASX|nr:M14 family metallocarboxypeptidase [Thalassotalea agarivorans]SET70617.1 Succinylglutamate desuccinylase / Aspartoacylase family protein [Thalassotalea agarivorans]